MKKGLGTSLIFLVGLLSVSALGFRQIIERPAKPVSENAGRIIKLNPSVLIEDVGGEYFFKNPRIIKMAPDGTYFVYDQGQLLQFDSRGRYLRNYFKRGQGPGELGYVSDFDFEPEHVIVHSNSPNKLVWFDLQGKLVKEVSLVSLASQLRFVMFQDGTAWFFKDIYPPPTGKGEAVDMRQVLVAVTGDGREASETAAFINKAVVAGGAVVFQSLHQVPLERRYIFVSNSREYALGVFDSRAKVIMKTISRRYERVKRPPGSQSASIVAPDGTRYEAPGSEYMEDVSGLYVYRQVVWATTSTRAKEKGVYVDVFDQEGRYVDAFWLKLDGLLLGICGDIVFVLEKNEDETLRITGFRVVGNEL
ncbi:MAG: 6-bladed beta-propeller [Candidatus Aminicenantales bacterium]